MGQIFLNIGVWLNIGTHEQGFTMTCVYGRAYSGVLTMTCVCGRAYSGVLTMTYVCGRADSGVLTVTFVYGRADSGVSMWCTYNDLCVW